MSVKSKPDIRSYCKAIRESFSPDKKQEFDQSITEGFLSLDEYKNCEVLLAFVSKDIEVNTEDIIAQAFLDGKTVAVPKCSPENCTMEYRLIRSRNDLECGFYGIYEPKESCERLTSFCGSICLVPGLAYDEERYRVGFGRGYYDKFLNEYTGVSIGLCYSDCVFDNVPKDSFDRPVDILITDNRIFRKDNGYGL